MFNYKIETKTLIDGIDIVINIESDLKSGNNNLHSDIIMLFASGDIRVINRDINKKREKTKYGNIFNYTISYSRFKDDAESYINYFIKDLYKKCDNINWRNSTTDTIWNTKNSTMDMK